MGSDVNASTWDGWTPLFEVIECNHPLVVRRLIDWKVDLHVRNIYGVTPLSCAKRLRTTKIVLMLEEQLRKENKGGIIISSELT